MKGPLHLSKFGDYRNVSVSAQIVEHLKPYQINGVRFLYQQCFIKQQNVIMNNDIGMNEPLQVSALFTAIPRPFTTLIVCQSTSLPKWHYEFSKSNLKILTPNELVKEDSSESETELPDAVVVTHDQIKYIKTLPIEEWFFFIIEDIDLIINSRFIKNITTQFRIALTSLNFVFQDNPELQWSILKWTNPNLVDDKETYIKLAKYSKDNLLQPFPDFWRRVTWIIEGQNKPNELEIQNYEEIIRDWSKRKNITIATVTKENTSQMKKRKSKGHSKNNKPNKRLITAKSKSNISEFSGTNSEKNNSDYTLYPEDQIFENISNIMNDINENFNIPGKGSDSETEVKNNILTYNHQKDEKTSDKKLAKSDYEINDSDDTTEELFKTEVLSNSKLNIIIKKKRKIPSNETISKGHKLLSTASIAEIAIESKLKNEIQENDCEVINKIKINDDKLESNLKNYNTNISETEDELELSETFNSIFDLKSTQNMSSKKSKEKQQISPKLTTKHNNILSKEIDLDIILDSIFDFKPIQPTSKNDSNVAKNDETENILDETISDDEQNCILDTLCKNSKSNFLANTKHSSSEEVCSILDSLF